MSSEKKRAGQRPGPRRTEPADPGFQKRWVDTPRLGAEQLDAAFRHGFDSRVRFADRPFHEVEHYLRESWEGMGRPEPWAEVCDVVRSGYERYKGAGFAPSTDLGPEALDRFTRFTAGGSAIGGGTLGERPLLGASAPVSDFDGEGGPPVGGEEEAGTEETDLPPG
ncbi:MAG TPA: hypothetical protein VKZ58_05560 [Longimicrobiales bacterium]|nr:hypothetical protein [Longimicrobiales bacterium]